MKLKKKFCFNPKKYGFNPKKYGFTESEYSILNNYLTIEETNLGVNPGDLCCAIKKTQEDKIDLSFKKLNNYKSRLLYGCWICYYFSPIVQKQEKKKLRDIFGFRPKKCGFKKDQCGVLSKSNIFNTEIGHGMEPGNLYLYAKSDQYHDLDFSFAVLDNYLGTLFLKNTYYYYFKPSEKN